MATIKGKDGTVTFDSGAVLEVLSFNFNEQGDTVESTKMGDDWATHVHTFKRWSGDVTVFWDPDDTTGQESVAIGDTVALVLAPEGATTTGDVSYTGNAILTEIGVQTTHDGLVQRTFTFQGTGALTKATAV